MDTCGSLGLFTSIDFVPRLGVWPRAGALIAAIATIKGIKIR